MVRTNQGQQPESLGHSFLIMLDQRTSIRDGASGGWHVEIVTPDGAQLNSPATLVELYTADGQIGVMAGHERLIAVLDEGELVIHNTHQRVVFSIGGGFVRVQPCGVSVLAFSLEVATDPSAMEKCTEQRRKLIGDDELSDPEFAP